MKMSRYVIAIAILAASVTTAFCAQKNAGNTPATPERANQDDGQKVFEQNCARCHNAPDGFSPRISATIARHMRVRANLSQKEEQALLRFLNP